MSTRLVDRVTEARRRSFVGREDERTLFRARLSGSDEPLLYVYGPGGVGKSTLLREYARLAEDAGRRVVWIDGRDLGPTPETAAQAVSDALHGASVSTLAGLAGAVLILDTAERLGALDRWLREDLLPTLPGDALVVLAGRDAPSVAWRADPGWASLLRPVRLGNLAPIEGAELLRGRGVPEADHAAALAFTHGHPLALALVAEVPGHGGIRRTGDAPQEVLSVLVGALVDQVPDAAHRAALEACAQVRVTTEPVLAALLGVPRAGGLFDWLRGLSIMEYSARGLVPHDLARDVLAAELRWRHPDQHAEIRQRARDHYRQRFATVPVTRQQEILADYAYLHRGNPLLGAMLSHIDPGGAGDPELSLGPATPAELPALRAMIDRYEGAASAALFDHWCVAQPAAVQAVRDSAGTPVGLQVLLALDGTTEAQRAADPGAVAAWAHVVRTAPPREGDRASMVRFWLAAQSYQDISAVQTLLVVHLVRHCLTTPRLAYHVFTAADPDAWAGLCAYADLHRVPGADFTVGRRRYGAYGHDWRVTPPLAWLELLAEREDDAGAPEPGEPPGVPAPQFDEEEFAEAVRGALRLLGRPDLLCNAPLAGARCVSGRAGVDAPQVERGRAVEQVVREAAAALAESVRDRPGYRALHHTYLQPAGTQQRAAELLDLPMSTYRRHLATGLRQLVAILWREELDRRG